MKSLLSRLLTNGKSRNSGARAKAKASLAVESLEDRCVPASVTLTSDHVLVIAGDNNVNDNAVVSSLFTFKTGGSVRVTLNGSDSFFRAADVSAIRFTVVSQFESYLSARNWRLA